MAVDRIARVVPDIQSCGVLQFRDLLLGTPQLALEEVGLFLQVLDLLTDLDRPDLVDLALVAQGSDRLVDLPQLALKVTAARELLFELSSDLEDVRDILVQAAIILARRRFEERCELTEVSPQPCGALASRRLEASDRIDAICRRRAGVPSLACVRSAEIFELRLGDLRKLACCDARHELLHHAHHVRLLLDGDCAWQGLSTLSLFRQQHRANKLAQ
mmetsp:Transcript_62145/g.180197  ORF Transcript_62145/g.180197 Transcript_62145/m.180197 type:complete len:217 (-) Transcript_62145:345-995(-)